jgi:magnesium transporter
MHKLLVCQNCTFRTDLPPEAISDVLANTQDVVWLDISDPDEQDIALLQEGFGFHPLAIEDAIRAHERPKVNVYSSYYFLVFYAVRYLAQNDEIELRALSLFIGANYLVTVHQGAFHQIEETRARWQAPDSPLGHRVAALVHALLDAVVDDYFPLMDQVGDRIDDLEDTIFAHFTESSIQTLFVLKKDLLRLRRAVAPERDVINLLLRRELPVFKAEDMAYLQDVYDHIVRVTDSIDTYRDLLSSALDSYLSVQSNNLNQIVKLLTMASIVLMSNALVAGIYGMNFQHMLPELSWKLGFPVTLGLMALISAALILYFRRRKWL